MKTRPYITPETNISSLLEDSMMEVISLPTTGQVDDPSFGQAKEINGLFDDKDIIILDSKPCIIYSVWEERKPNLIYDVWSDGEE
jgi:hypothetical protein